LTDPTTPTEARWLTPGVRGIGAASQRPDLAPWFVAAGGRHRLCGEGRARRRGRLAPACTARGQGLGRL